MFLKVAAIAGDCGACSLRKGGKVSGRDGNFVSLHFAFVAPYGVILGITPTGSNIPPCHHAADTRHRQHPHRPRQGKSPQWRGEGTGVSFYLHRTRQLGTHVSQPRPRTMRVPPLRGRPQSARKSKRICMGRLLNPRRHTRWRRVPAERKTAAMKSARMEADDDSHDVTKTQRIPD